MAKTKNKSQKEQTIQQKEQNLKQIFIFEEILCFIITFYIGINMDCYYALNPRANFGDIFTKALNNIMENPLYFLPINYSMNMALSFPIIFMAILFASYTYQKMRVHHNVNTLKGRTKWADFSDILERYAEKE